MSVIRDFVSRVETLRVRERNEIKKKVMPYLFGGEVYPLVAISTQSSEFESNVCRMRDKGNNSAARRHVSDKYCKWQQNTGLNFLMKMTSKVI